MSSNQSYIRINFRDISIRDLLISSCTYAAGSHIFLNNYKFQQSIIPNNNFSSHKTKSQLATEKIYK